MTFEERIERLTERHEALTQSVEVLHAESVEHTKQLEIQRAESAGHTKQIELLVAVVKQDAENIRALARIADMHDRRLTKLEGSENRS